MKNYLIAAKLFNDNAQERNIVYTDVYEFDLCTVTPNCSGPKRAQDKLCLSSMKSDFQQCLLAPTGFRVIQLICDEFSCSITYFHFRVSIFHRKMSIVHLRLLQMTFWNMVQLLLLLLWVVRMVLAMPHHYLSQVSKQLIIFHSRLKLTMMKFVILSARSLGWESVETWTSNSELYSDLFFSWEWNRYDLFERKWNLESFRRSWVCQIIIIENVNETSRFSFSFRVTGYGCSTCNQNEENQEFQSTLKQFITEVND